MPRINFLFVLITLLTSCTSNTTSVPTPTETSSPVAAEVVIINMNPAGFDMASTDPLDNNSELFVPLSVNDIQNPNPDDMVIPSELIARDNEIVVEMNSKLQKVAEICDVPVKYLKPVWKAHKVVDVATSRAEYRWTRVFEANIPTGEEIPAGIYTCWTRDVAGLLNTYPTAWDGNGKLVVNDGNCFERLEGQVKWAGTTPVIYDAAKNKFAIPSGSTYDVFIEESTWKALETDSIVEVVNPVANPFSSENMNILTTGGYRWDSITGSLKNADGITTLRYQNGKLVDSAGVEIAVEALKSVETNGVDFQGRDVVVLTREVNGEKQIALPSGEWVTPLDIASAIALFRNNEGVLTVDNWGTYDKVKYDQIPTIASEDVENQRLLYSELLSLPPLPENANIQPLAYMRLSFTNGYYPWVLTQYPTSSLEENVFLYDVTINRPIVYENDVMAHKTSVYRVEGEDSILVGMRYFYNGTDIILRGRFTGVDFDTVSRAIWDPAWLIAEPIVSNEAASLMPSEVQKQIANEESLTGVADARVPVGDEIKTLGGVIMDLNATHQHYLQLYLMPESDPFFDEFYPNP